jgi:secreted PhoX family phosphatase
VAAPPGFVALLMGDDIEFGRAPLYLYVGRKDPAGNFPARNGLRNGRLHVWVSDQGDRSPADWHGTGTQRHGRFVQIAARNDAGAGASGHDATGYLDDTTLREVAWQLGAFSFSRPEDLHANPAHPSEAVFASTGHGKLFPQDDWGTLYRIDMHFDAGADGFPTARATLRILHDGDDFAGQGIRSPDNLTWARDGMVYVQEDKATRRARFGGDTGVEASIWRIDPGRPADYQRIAVIDRSVLVPPGVRDTKAGRLGAWETSGIIDVSDQLDLPRPRLALLLTAQAHGLRGGPVGGKQALVEGGQLILLTRD